MTSTKLTTGDTYAAADLARVKPGAINSNRTVSVGPAREDAVCYGMGPDRFVARDYIEHVLRSAVNERRDKETLAIIERKRDAATILTSARG